MSTYDTHNWGLWDNPSLVEIHTAERTLERVEPDLKPATEAGTAEPAPPSAAPDERFRQDGMYK